MTGTFIVLYGINNLGKSTQAHKLVERLQSEGKKAVYWKYPRYDVEPLGPMISDYLRAGNPYNFSNREAQILHYADRLKVEAELKDLLASGTHVIAEDYFGTALAWGIGTGVEKELLVTFYQSLLKEDIAILFDGERFTEAIETTHKNETDNTLNETVRHIHRELAKEYNWHLIDANESIDQIHEKIWSMITTPSQ